MKAVRRAALIGVVLASGGMIGALPSSAANSARHDEWMRSASQAEPSAGAKKTQKKIHHTKKHGRRTKSRASEKHYGVIIPKSSVPKPGDAGKRAHTHYEILNTHGPVTPPHPGRTPEQK